MKAIDVNAPVVHLPHMVELQKALENEATQLGMYRYQSSLAEGHLSNVPAGIVLLRNTIQAYLTVFRDWYERTASVRAMKSVYNAIEGDLKDTTPEEIAYIVCKRIINALGDTESIQSVAIGISNMLLRHNEYRKMTKAHKGFVKDMQGRLISSTKVFNERFMMQSKRKLLGIEDTKWTNILKYKVGIKLMHLFQVATGFIDKYLYEMEGFEIKRGSRIGATPKLMGWLEEQHSRCELLQPVLLPMVIRPLKWTNLQYGGYLTIEKPLIKTRHMGIFNELCARHDSYDLCETINRIQSVPFRIDTELYELMSKLWDSGEGIGDMPPRQLEEYPDKPEGTDDYALRVYKRKKVTVYERNRTVISKRIAYSMKLWVAEKFKDQPNIYFTWFFDWRGRMYPEASYLNPQTDDSRALLRFSHKVKLGKYGKFWLYVHTANCYGLDKQSYSERIKWVQTQINKRIKVETLWRKADRPFEFYTAYKECMKLALHEKEGKSTASFMSDLIVANDGTCNGLQHLSALLLDSHGAKTVNLAAASNTDKPSDVYQVIADRCIECLQEEEREEYKGFARLLVPLITRKFVKQNVMTTPYGVTIYGMREQLLSYIKKDTEWLFTGEIPVNDLKSIVSYFVNIIAQAIDECLPSVRIIMDWLKDISNVLTEYSVRPEWEAPSGFPVIQEYRQVQGKSIYTFWGTMRIRNWLQEDIPETIDKSKNRKGIAPNYIHSLDAAHMLMTIRRCSFDDCAMVHDRYGCHAGNMEEMQRVLREVFVEMYQVDEDRQGMLHSFREECIIRLAAQGYLVDEDGFKEGLTQQDARELIPQVPTLGTFDINEVSKSAYFYS